jgi:hypothetical protein
MYSTTNICVDILEECCNFWETFMKMFFQPSLASILLKYPQYVKICSFLNFIFPYIRYLRYYEIRNLPKFLYGRLSHRAALFFLCKCKCFLVHVTIFVGFGAWTLRFLLWARRVLHRLYCTQTVVVPNMWVLVVHWQHSRKRGKHSQRSVHLVAAPPWPFGLGTLGLLCVHVILWSPDLRLRSQEDVGTAKLGFWRRSSTFLPSITVLVAKLCGNEVLTPEFRAFLVCSLWSRSGLRPFYVQRLEVLPGTWSMLTSPTVQPSRLAARRQGRRWSREHCTCSVQARKQMPPEAWEQVPRVFGVSPHLERFEVLVVNVAAAAEASTPSHLHRHHFAPLQHKWVAFTYRSTVIFCIVYKVGSISVVSRFQCSVR